MYIIVYLLVYAYGMHQVNLAAEHMDTEIVDTGGEDRDGYIWVSICLCICVYACIW